MNRTIEYEELIRLFPTLSVGLVTPMRCVFPVRGHGRCVKRTSGQPPLYGDVVLSASPAGVLSVRFEHAWPTDLVPEEVARLDESLLLGIAEGISREALAPMECAITTILVDHRSGETRPAAVRIAAAAAVRDMSRRPGWEGREHDDSPPDVA